MNKYKTKINRAIPSDEEINQKKDFTKLYNQSQDMYKLHDVRKNMHKKRNIIIFVITAIAIGLALFFT